ncbi:MAG: pilus assembly protein PilM [Pirellulales bacterium]
MAKNHAVWGIDIGQCALKALRCRPHDDDPTKLIADSFDYIEYPKILSQPDAEPAALVAEALKQFLSRNEVRGSRVAISVSGQSGLARFIKLPPVESKKIPDIVKFEAKQQIPFALDDVVWDYQQMVGGSDEEGFALETEVGLFAMKRDQVMRALAPLDEAGIDVDYIQLTPLAICNYAVYDVIEEVPPPEEYDPEDPPPSTVVLSLGTDTTDLVVTNGYRVWQRSIPIGGNHFTKAISKELRLTFSKAEHLKRNATKAEDPKAVYKAMRSVFSDLLSEVQRSIGYFSSIDRHAKIGKIVALGNAMRLPGLKKYLTQNLEQPVAPVESFRQLEGATVTEAPQFQENILSFGVCYGLCLQGLGRSKIYTNLLPGEILTERLIREKKPWAVGAAAAIFIACTISFGVLWAKWSTANVESDEFKSAFQQLSTVESTSQRETSAFRQAEQSFGTVNTIRGNLLSNVEGRLLWLELVKAINEALPQDPADARPEDIRQRMELHIVTADCENFADLSTWYTAPIAEEFQRIVASRPAPGGPRRRTRNQGKRLQLNPQPQLRS